MLIRRLAAGTCLIISTTLRKIRKGQAARQEANAYFVLKVPKPVVNATRYRISATKSGFMRAGLIPAIIPTGS